MGRKERKLFNQQYKDYMDVVVGKTDKDDNFIFSGDYYDDYSESYVDNQDVKVIKSRTKSWQPFMNKLSPRNRKSRKRIMQKRIRRASKNLEG